MQEAFGLFGLYPARRLLPLSHVVHHGFQTQKGPLDKFFVLFVCFRGEGRGEGVVTF